MVSVLNLTRDLKQQIQDLMPVSELQAVMKKRRRKQSESDLLAFVCNKLEPAGIYIPASDSGWNEMIDLLDAVYPDWRGYPNPIVSPGIYHGG